MMSPHLLAAAATKSRHRLLSCVGRRHSVRPSPTLIRMNYCRRIQRLQEETGGFGGMLVMIYDFADEQKQWEHSLDLLIDEVMPHFPD